MAQLKSVSLADQVFEKLENDIITGRYARGEILTELKLVEQLGVSRTPIREALRRLEQERLIQESGKGSVVRGISVEDLVDIMQIRERIEPLAARYAAKSITSDELSQLRQINELQEFYFTKNDPERLREMDDRFHDSIYSFCKRSILCDTLRPLHRKSQMFRRAAMSDPKRLENSIQEHNSIFHAIASGNEELAAHLTKLHIGKAKEYMIARFDYHG